jgi:hypothetical protein
LASGRPGNAVATDAVVDDGVVVTIDEVVNDGRLIVYSTHPVASDHVQTD